MAVDEPLEGPAQGRAHPGRTERASRTEDRREGFPGRSAAYTIGRAGRRTGETPSSSHAASAPSVFFPVPGGPASVAASSMVLRRRATSRRHGRPAHDLHRRQRDLELAVDPVSELDGHQGIDPVFGERPVPVDLGRRRSQDAGRLLGERRTRGDRRRPPAVRWKEGQRQPAFAFSRDGFGVAGQAVCRGRDGELRRGRKAGLGLEQTPPVHVDDRHIGCAQPQQSAERIDGLAGRKLRIPCSSKRRAVRSSAARTPVSPRKPQFTVSAGRPRPRR